MWCSVSLSKRRLARCFVWIQARLGLRPPSAPSPLVCKGGRVSAQERKRRCPSPGQCAVTLTEIQLLRTLSHLFIWVLCSWYLLDFLRIFVILDFPTPCQPQKHSWNASRPEWIHSALYAKARNPARFGELEALADPPASLWPMAARACNRRGGQVFAGKPPTLLPRPGEFQPHPIGASQFTLTLKILPFSKGGTKKEIPATSSPVAFIVMANISWDTGAWRYMEKLIHFTIKAKILKLHWTWISPWLATLTLLMCKSGLDIF